MWKRLCGLIFIVVLVLVIPLELLATAFTANGDATVIDRSTGLIWQQMDDGTERTWKRASAYCRRLKLAGESDWRLPTIRELVSIVDRSKYNPAINTITFPDTHSSYYWSSTVNANNKSHAWRMYFSNGYVSDSGRRSYYYVRCVRGGR